MNFIDEVRSDREDLARVLKKHLGIRKIVEELYPDNAHFIYELLQNAEDTGATEAKFILKDDHLVFEHNGRPFEAKDIYGITDIGEGTKSEDNDKIGRFGVGFKAVFAYSETPHIWSPTFAFKISDLVLPSAIAARKELGGNTRFEFPFNNPKKLPTVAYAEINSGLSFLPESALLFLGNIKSITWTIGEGEATKISRTQYSDCHIELTREVGANITRTHFLQFKNQVENLPKQYVAIAFNLYLLPQVAAFNVDEELSSQFRIVPATPGQVSVFFPAEKETSGLRFHLHAPFVPELSRASIKETPANSPLYSQLASLTATSLHRIRDLGLLTGEFLAALPNPQDTIPQRYQVIRSAIVEAMNEQALTPTHSKSHAPAKSLLQAKASLKDLLSSPDDIRFLNTDDYNVSPYKSALNCEGWVVGASQKHSNQDRFLSGLAIRDWNIDNFVKLLESAMENWYWEDDTELQKWITKKTDEWHQQLYALLYREATSVHSEMEAYFVFRCSDGTYRRHDECYFSSNIGEDGGEFPLIAEGVYRSGNNTGQQEDSRKFLETIGVHVVNEADRIKAILLRDYSEGRSVKDVNLEHVERFIKFAADNPQQVGVFYQYHIFRCKDGFLRKGSQVFLDAPFLYSGLEHYHRLFKSQKRWPLTDSYYQVTEFRNQDFVNFAQLVGAQIELKITKASCWSNPQKNDFVMGSPGGWSDSYGINLDYTIEGLTELLSQKDESVSKLVWKTISEQKNSAWMKAEFRNNSQHPIRRAHSQLFAKLRDSAWIPQKGGAFVQPSKALRELLPEGLAYDEGYEWIKEIKFGSRAGNKPVEESTKNPDISKARELGFNDENALRDAQKFAKLDPGERRKFFDDQERKSKFQLPDNSPKNAQLRAERVGLQAQDAPERISELRTRSVSIGRDDVKKEAAQYLQQQYTNSDGEMICQVCQDVLPFKLADDSYYFEKVEFLPNINNRHYQNYLALCPNHAAMYQHANGSADKIRDAISALLGNELGIVLAGTDHSIYFTETHIADMKKVVEVDLGVNVRNDRDSEILEDEEA